MAAQCYFLCVRKVIQLQVPISHVKGKLVNCEHCFEKGSCPKEPFLRKKGFFCIKGLPNVSLLCVQEVIQLQVPISCVKGKLVNYGHCFEKGSYPKENFLHKNGFFCIKGLLNVTFYACKRLCNCRYQYHMRRENQSTTSIVLKKVHAQKKIFCIKMDFSAQKGCPMLLFYVCKKSFNCRYQYHARRENQ